MTDKLREAAQQVLYAMAMLIDPEKLEPWQIELYDKTTNALRAALAEQPSEQAPYCYTYTENGEEYFTPPTGYRPDHAKPLYTAPQPAQQCNCVKRESLTDFDIADRFYAIGGAGANCLRYFAAGVRYAEAAHGIGGGV